MTATLTRSITATDRYLKLKREGGLNAVWGAMPKRKRVYATELVEKFGWKVDCALEEAFVRLPSKKDIHKWLYDDRGGRVATYGVHVNGKTGHIGRPYSERECVVERFIKCGYTADEATVIYERGCSNAN